MHPGFTFDQDVMAALDTVNNPPGTLEGSDMLYRRAPVEV
jgi:hypothetical protein